MAYTLHLECCWNQFRSLKSVSDLCWEQREDRLSNYYSNILSNQRFQNKPDLAHLFVPLPNRSFRYDLQFTQYLKYGRFCTKSPAFNFLRKNFAFLGPHSSMSTVLIIFYWLSDAESKCQFLRWVSIQFQVQFQVHPFWLLGKNGPGAF